MGSQPSVSFAISKILNDIGSIYLDDGISWISDILDKNKDYYEKKIEANTIYYLENIARTYAFKNREKLRKQTF